MQKRSLSRQLVAKWHIENSKNAASPKCRLRNYYHHFSRPY